MNTLNVSRQALLEACKLFRAIIPRKSVIPVLTAVIIEISQDRLTLRATDLETHLVIKLIGEPVGDGPSTALRSLIPFHSLHETIRAMKPDSVTLALTAMGGPLTITVAESGSVTLAPLGPVEDFPTQPPMPDGAPFTVEAAPFKELLERVSGAMAGADTRFAIAGIQLKVDPSCLTAAATDGHRLQESRIAITSPTHEKFVIGAVAVGAVKHLPEAPLSLSFAKGFLAIEWPEGFLLTKASDKPFPNYEGVIPKGNPFKAITSRQALLDALGRIVKLLPRRGSRSAKFSFGNEALLMSAGGVGDAPAVESGVPIQFVSAPMEIGFNADYIREAVAAFPGDEIEMRLGSAQNAVWMFPAGRADSMSCTLMPTRL